MVLANDDVLEKEWQASTLPEHREAIEDLMSFVLISFGARLRGDTVGVVVGFATLLG